MKVIAYVSLLLFYYGCNSVENSEKYNIDLIKKEWINSTQEYYEEFDEYIPIDSKELPLLRYRQKYIFDDNGECKYFYLSHSDAHYYKDGKWKYENNESILTIYDLKDQLIVKYKVKELSSTLLKVREIE